MEFSAILSYIREVFGSQDQFIPLHAPVFEGNEKKYVLDTIDSTFVSSVGAYVNRFEDMMKQITGAKHAVAIANGTTALNLALIVADVKHGDEVITQPLTFVATSNAIAHIGARPVFVDVDKDTMGLSPVSLQAWLEENAVLDSKNQCINRTTGRRIAACVPMHTFGFPLRIDEVVTICRAYNISVVEDAAESLGSWYKNMHTGRFGLVGTFSFNGNKTVTCGGGGAIITDDDKIAQKAKHLSTTAKIPHAWEFIHDEIGYNLRMPNLNAALACAQLEQLNSFIENKRDLAQKYRDFFSGSHIQFVSEGPESKANYWLNTILVADKSERNRFLEFSNKNNIMTRPAWRLIPSLRMYEDCQRGNIDNAYWLEDRIVNLPSSVRN